MEVRAIYKYAKISPFKAREVTREIQGLPVSAALDIVAYSPKKAAALVNQTLKSAVANAENNANLKVDGLVVKEAIVGEGPTMKRMMARDRGSGGRIVDKGPTMKRVMARPRGSASRILKRSSHIRIVLTDEIKIETRETRKAAEKAAKKKAGESKTERGAADAK